MLNKYRSGKLGLHGSSELMKDLDHLEEVADDLRKLHEDEQGQAGSERYKLTEAANQSVSAIDQEFKEKAL